MMRGLECRKDPMGSSLCFFLIFMGVREGEFIFVATFRDQFISFIEER